jgi:CubicO group peptidase (beta-lactamase class C family)
LPSDLIADVATKQPLWPPKQKSTYSNLNFILLGLVVENATGKSYSEFVQEAILSPLHMKMSSFVKPNDSVAVLPKGDNSWDIEEGVRRP